MRQAQAAMAAISTCTSPITGTNVPRYQSHPNDQVGTRAEQSHNRNCSAWEQEGGKSGIP